MPAVLRPLPHVPQHVEQTERVGIIRTRRRRMHCAVVTGCHRPTGVDPLRRRVRSVRMSALRRRPIPPVPTRRRTPARRVLPFRFARKPIPFPRLLAQPPHVRLRIRPAHAHHRMAVPLRKSGGTPRGIVIQVPASVPHVATTRAPPPCRRHERRVLPPRHLVPPQRKPRRSSHAGPTRRERAPTGMRSTSNGARGSLVTFPPPSRTRRSSRPGSSMAQSSPYHPPRTAARTRHGPGTPNARQTTAQATAKKIRYD